MYQYPICWSRFINCRLIIDPHNEQFPFGLIAQQVEHRLERAGFASRSGLPRCYNGRVKKKKLQGSHTSNLVSTRSSNTWLSCIDIISIAHVFKQSRFGWTMAVLSTEHISGKVKITWDKRFGVFVSTTKKTENASCFVEQYCSKFWDFLDKWYVLIPFRFFIANISCLIWRKFPKAFYFKNDKDIRIFH